MKAEEMLFRTVVEVPEWRVPMQAHHRFVMLGSCFAQNMGEVFESYGLQCVCNPLGAAYNPESIAIQVEQSLKAPSKSFEPPSVALPNCSASNGQLPLDGKPFFTAPSPFKGETERVWCWWANTLLSDTDEERFRETIQQTFLGLGEALRSANFLFVTLGTNICYRLKESGMTVANCHKMPSRLFDEVTLDVEACTETLGGMVERLSQECPELRVIFTVSPYRYKKYGFHGSQLSKATLLLAVDRVLRRYPEKVGYFPAYEIVMDELRDYRFYADDMIHPAPAAVNYIWQRMVENSMSEEMRQYLKDYEPTRKAKGHRGVRD